jgi:stage II sporulation protein D
VLVAVKAANGRISIGNKEAALALLTGTYDIVAGEEKARLKYPVQITNSRESLSIVATIPLEDYVAAVLAGEAGGFKNAESLKAMAVVVRTYAIHFKGRHDAENFDACDSTHCQDLRLSFINGRMKAAADATAGELLWYNGETAATYYHSDCGGTTEQGGLLQHSANVAYLPVHTDAYCIRNGGRTWRSEITRADLIRALRDAQLTQQTSVDDVAVIARTQSGRAKRVRLRGSSTVELSAEVFRLAVGRSLGWTKIRSDLYQVSSSGDSFVFSGRGAGHGVGLSSTRVRNTYLRMKLPEVPIGSSSSRQSFERILGKSLGKWTGTPRGVPVCS